MTTCLSTDDTSELAFVQSLRTRSTEVGECRGPLLALAFPAWKVFAMEQIFDSETATDLLWDGHLEQGSWSTGVLFSLCAAHWLDLATLTWMRSRQYNRSDWRSQSDELLRQMCQIAGWDPKEIVNMFAWQRQELT